MNCLTYLLKNEIEQEELDLYILYHKYIKEYQKNVCSKCIGTKQQEKRECGILNGFSNVGCENMTKTITKKIKEKNKKLIKKIISFQVLLNVEKVA